MPSQQPIFGGFAIGCSCRGLVGAKAVAPKRKLLPQGLLATCNQFQNMFTRCTCYGLSYSAFFLYVAGMISMDFVKCVGSGGGRVQSVREVFLRMLRLPPP